MCTPLSDAFPLVLWPRVREKTTRRHSALKSRLSKGFVKSASAKRKRIIEAKAHNKSEAIATIIAFIIRRIVTMLIARSGMRSSWGVDLARAPRHRHIESTLYILNLIEPPKVPHTA
jgi:hypothetical protein